MTTEAYDYEKCRNCGAEQLSFALRDGLCYACDKATP